eukprot:6236318-Karenia_brevis.AAC.1
MCIHVCRHLAQGLGPYAKVDADIHALHGPLTCSVGAVGRREHVLNGQRCHIVCNAACGGWPWWGLPARGGRPWACRRAVSGVLPVGVDR